MAKMMNSQDAVSGKEGSVFLTIDGQNIEVAELIKINASVTYTKASVKGVNRRMTGHKIVGGEGTGEMSMYFHRPEMKQLASNYVKLGQAPVFHALVTNADVSSRAGTYSANLQNIVPDETLIASLDGDSDDLLVDEFSFTFDHFDILQNFNVIN